MFKGREMNENNAKDRNQLAVITLLLITGILAILIGNTTNNGAKDLSMNKLSLTSPAVRSMIKDKNITLMGVANGPVVNLEKNGELLATTKSERDGKYRMQVSANKLLGVTEIVVRDQEGALIDKLESLVFDFAPGVINRTPDDEATEQTSESAVPKSTKLKIISHSNGDGLKIGPNVVEGTGLPGTTVVLRLDSTVVFRAKVDKDGRWTAIFDLTDAAESRALAASTANPLTRTPPIKVSVDP